MPHACHNGRRRLPLSIDKLQPKSVEKHGAAQSKKRQRRKVAQTSGEVDSTATFSNQTRKQTPASRAQVLYLTPAHTVDGNSYKYPPARFPSENCPILRKLLIVPDALGAGRLGRCLSFWRVPNRPRASVYLSSSRFWSI